MPIRKFIHLVVILVSFGLSASAKADIRVSDAMGRELVLAHPAQRVISLAPHITEIVYAAGAGAQLVGAVSYSDYPEPAKALPRVGSSDSISYESLLALRPDLVLAWRGGNSQETIARLESFGLKVFVHEPKALEDVAASLQAVGRLTGNEAVAQHSARKFSTELDRLRTRYSGLEPVSVYYQIWNEPLLTLNDDHLISDVIRLCGGRNIFADVIPLVSRISVEAVLRANPQVVVASGMDQARPEWLDDWLRWDSMRAVKHGQLYFVPPDLLQRHTPRILQGAAQLCAALDQARGYYAGLK